MTIEQLDASGTLDPVPINQEYDLILNLLSTPAVQSIKHADGEPVNITNIIQTVTEGYANYCYLTDDKVTSRFEIPGSKILLILIMD